RTAPAPWSASAARPPNRRAASVAPRSARRTPTSSPLASFACPLQTPDTAARPVHCVPEGELLQSSQASFVLQLRSLPATTTLLAPHSFPVSRIDFLKKSAFRPRAMRSVFSRRP